MATTIDQSKLNPEQQATLFALMKQSGQQPTTNMGEASPPGAPDVQAQAGLDPAAVQQLQQGGKLTPEQAMPIIAHIMKNPQGVGALLSPQLQQDPHSPMLQAEYPSDNPIKRLFGMKDKFAVSSTNYLPSFQSLYPKAPLPANLPVGPDGQPFMTEKVYKNLVTPEAAAAKIANATGKATSDYYNTDEMVAMGMPKARAQAMYNASMAKGLPGAPKDAAHKAIDLLGQAGTAGNRLDQNIKDAMSSFDKDAEKEKDGLQELGKAQSLIANAATNPASANAVPITLSRLLTGTSRLNMVEINSQGGSQAVLDKLSQLANRAKDGTLTADNVKWMQEMADIIGRAYVNGIDTIGRTHAQRLSRITGTPVKDGFEMMVGRAYTPPQDTQSPPPPVAPPPAVGVPHPTIRIKAVRDLGNK